MRTYAAIACLVVSIALFGIARGEDLAGPAAAAPQAAMPVYGYPDRWSIKSFLSREATATRPALRRPIATRGVTYGYGVSGVVADDYAEGMSLLQRLKALKSLRLATLWRGRDRALIVGIQDGGYVGVSLDDTSDDSE